MDIDPIRSQAVVPTHLLAVGTLGVHPHRLDLVLEPDSEVVLLPDTVRRKRRSNTTSPPLIDDPVHLLVIVRLLQWESRKGDELLVGHRCVVLPDLGHARGDQMRGKLQPDENAVSVFVIPRTTTSFVGNLGIAWLDDLHVPQSVPKPVISEVLSETAQPAAGEFEMSRAVTLAVRTAHWCLNLQSLGLGLAQLALGPH